jgi:ATP-binding protein involved in chromosome partitioning
MSWLEQPDGTRLEVFGSGGGRRVAQRLSATVGTDVPLLGQVPLDVEVRQAGDDGTPVVLAAPESPGARVLRDVARAIAARSRGLAGMQLGISPVSR